MKWLHISDIHFSPEDAGRSTKQLTQKLPLFLKEQGIVVDEVFVTGDYRHAGRQKDLIDVAQSAVDYIKLIASSVGVNEPSHIHIIPGNHDLERHLSSEEITAIRKKYDVRTGRFSDADFNKLANRFSFFDKITESLYKDNSIWAKGPGSLHKYQCNKEYNLIYMNTAISCGAEACLIPEVHTDIDNLCKYLELERRKNKSSGIVIVAEGENGGGAIKVAEKVKGKLPSYEIRVTTLGHIQRGGSPTNGDRVLASTLGCEAVNALMAGRSGIMVGQINGHIVYTPLEEAISRRNEINKKWYEMNRILSL